MSQSLLLAILAGALGGGIAVWLLHHRPMARLRRLEGLWGRLSSEILKETHRGAQARDLTPVSREYAQLTGEGWNEVLHESQRLDAMLRGMPEGVALIDRESIVLFCNPGFTTLFRVREGQRIDPTIFDAGGATSLMRAIEEGRGSGRASSMELHLATTPPRDILLTLTPYSDERASQCLILNALDITNRKRMEQLRTEFVANVSHELRTPLAAIRGYIETCLDEDGLDPASPVSRFLPVINQHALRLSALIEDLLVLSRIESRAMELSIHPTALPAVVDNAISTLHKEAEKRRVRLLNVVPGLLPDVKADLPSLERILLNLIDNAIKYSDEDSEVRISARSQGDMVCVMVEDEGVGIAREHQSRIFERFYRVDKGRSRKAGGTGLGLSIVRHLVRAHGGEVWLDSEPGRGSTFFFTLPVAPAGERVAPPAAGS